MVINGRWVKNKFLHVLYLAGREISGIRNAGRKKDGRKNILLFCQSQTMEEHLLNFAKQLKGRPEYALFLCFGEDYPDGKRHKKADTLFRDTRIPVIGDTWRLYFMRWALVVCPDMDYPFWMKRGTIPALYIGHGSGGISYDGGETSYDYSSASLDEKGRPLFDVMLEPNKETARLMKADPVYGPVIRSAGYRFAYKFRDASSKKAECQRRLGIPEGKKVVSVWGSWNKESLFHVLGPELFEVCRELKKKGYEFIFSIHGREYQKYDDQIEPLGELVEKQRENGFFVRSPGEDWLPYMLSSDMIVVDYSSMLSLAVLAGKKVILSDFPDGRIWRKSMYYEIKQVFPVISDAGGLEQALEDLERTDRYDFEIARFREQLYVSEADYKKFIQDVVGELTSDQTDRRKNRR